MHPLEPLRRTYVPFVGYKIETKDSGRIFTAKSIFGCSRATFAQIRCSLRQGLIYLYFRMFI